MFLRPLHFVAASNCNLFMLDTTDNIAMCVCPGLAGVAALGKGTIISLSTTAIFFFSIFGCAKLLIRILVPQPETELGQRQQKY